MPIKYVEIRNARSFERARCEFSPGINLLIGPNNSGKSTILKAIFMLQEGLSVFRNDDIRIGATHELYVDIGLEGVTQRLSDGSTQEPERIGLHLKANKGRLQGQVKGANTSSSFRPFPASQPDNLLCPILSGRKRVAHSPNVTAETADTVTGNFSNLYAKVLQLSDPGLGEVHDRYMDTCMDVLGFHVTASPSAGGIRAGLTVGPRRAVPMEAMGEGVANIVGLVVELCTAEGKVFLIEEPENDLHPTALKGVLSLMRDAAAKNQFIITTHSHIVLVHLGGHEDARVFEVSMSLEDRVPKSTVEPVPNKPEDHRRVLENLGYEMCDYGMYEGWLLLEESSAERIIRDYLIRWFVPELEGKIRTYSAQGFGRVPIKFEYFNRLFVFTHLQAIYRNRAWVILDDGDDERAVIDKMRETYEASGWNADRFLQFEKHDFEEYYPDKFPKDVRALPTGRSERRKAKEKLLRNVLKWIKEDDQRAKEAFSVSAAEVIKKLETIAAALAGKEGRS